MTPPTAAGETLEMNISTRHVINLMRKITGVEDVKYFEKKWMCVAASPYHFVPTCDLCQRATRVNVTCVSVCLCRDGRDH